ncbi:hypothetical protein AQS8620_01325 [Aquimixticola soesokkakensis]|uniref:Uncharacterized protein n=1 Tax=Aquimixticola soesokkakensis TaxID=1519096 RepID=A0A1Y5SDS6_9RHOB|nr:hypothetical protein [Aquimixticola soesokkakensis]SLN36869.1 hypothetical protein AQS8620_01325 [Aquimixticola soesokkakensis]
MTQRKTPTQVAKVEPHDPYKMRTIEQILALFDSGDFLAQVLEGHKQLQLDLLEHKAEHGTKGCQGSMTLQVSYALGKSGDVAMGATVSFKAPKKPPSSAAAFINDNGELTLYSPFMARMHQPIRDVEDFDPETGEIRDID